MLARLDQAPRSVVWIVRVMTIVVAVSVTGGLIAAIAGGSWSDLGSGYGGLYAFPAMITTLVALASIPIAIVAVRRVGPADHRLRAALVIAGGAWVVAFGYATIAHIVDPCLNGWWDAGSRIGSQPLCERFDATLNWHTRFHLLAHAAPAAVMLAAYLVAVRRWGQPQPSAPDADRDQSGIDEPVHSTSAHDADPRPRLQPHV